MFSFVMREYIITYERRTTLLHQNIYISSYIIKRVYEDWLCSSVNLHVIAYLNINIEQISSLYEYLHVIGLKYRWPHQVFIVRPGEYKDGKTTRICFTYFSVKRSQISLQENLTGSIKKLLLCFRVIRYFCLKSFSLIAIPCIKMS